MTLTLKYRPVTFADVVGQAHIVPVLQAMVRTGRLPTTLILAGQHGTGKTSTARILAAALNCEAPTDAGDCCGTCEACQAVQGDSSASVIEVDAASSGGVAEVARIRELCLYAQPGRWRVVLLDEAHSMSREAFNALLKILEEPPAQTVFVLVTTEPDKILPTVRSRAMAFEYRQVHPDLIAGRLQDICQTEQIPAQPDLLALLAQQSRGHLRDALMLLEQASLTGSSTAEQFRSVYGIPDVSVSLVQAALKSDLATCLSLTEKFFLTCGDLKMLMDQITRTLVMTVQAASGAVTDGPFSALAAMQPKERLYAGLHVLWDLQDRATTTHDTQSLAQLAMSALCRSLGGPVQVVDVPPETVAQPAEQTILSVEHEELSAQQAFDLLRSSGLVAG